MSVLRQISIKTDDHTPQKWSVSLKEDVFKRFISQESPVAVKIFEQGSMFSPLLFGKFFDPSDAFPLWDFESGILLSALRSRGKTSVDWFQSDNEYVLKAEIPGAWENNVQVYVDNGKVVEISGQWRQHKDAKVKDWRCGNWWEYGYVRRLELPEDADCKTVEATLNSEMHMELRILKKDAVSAAKNGTGNGSNSV